MSILRVVGCKVSKVKLGENSKTDLKCRCQRSVTDIFGIYMLGKDPSVRLCQICNRRVTTLWLVGCWKSVDFLFVHGLYRFLPYESVHKPNKPSILTSQHGLPLFSMSCKLLFISIVIHSNHALLTFLSTFITKETLNIHICLIFHLHWINRKRAGGGIYVLSYLFGLFIVKTCVSILWHTSSLKNATFVWKNSEKRRFWRF